MSRKVIIERIPGPLASLYEKATRMVIESYYRQVAKEIVSSLRTGLILDLGTGPGYLPIEIVKRSPSLKVHGIDLSRKLIHMAKENALKANVDDRLHFEVGNAAQLRFDADSYDMVISTGMLHMLKDPIQVLRECHRVLKSGGEAWIYDPARVSSQIDIQKWKASLTLRERLMYVLFQVFTRINPPHTYNREQIMAMIAETPFQESWIEQENHEMRMKLLK